MSDDELIQEKLLDRNTGYLRVPQAVKDEFGAPIRYPNPTWRIGKNDKKTLELVYVFNKKELKRD